MSTERIKAVDLFCGAGGSSWGARRAGAVIVAGFDRWELAGKVYQDNFPEAKFFGGSLEGISRRSIQRAVGSIDLLLASPECTNHSPAKGKGERCEKSKDSAFQVIRFAKTLKPRWIVVENVNGMRNWSRFAEFVGAIRQLGYHVKECVLNAAEFGVPQRRRRLFLLCDRDHEPPPIELTMKPGLCVKEILDGNGRFPFSPLRTPKRAQATIERADRAIAKVGSDEPFLIVYYGSDNSGFGGWQRLDEPLRTITTLDRFALVKPSSRGHVMRMLQVPELKAAMGMPQRFRFDHGTRRDRIRMIGNAVCPPVMTQVIRQLTR